MSKPTWTRWYCSTEPWWYWVCGGMLTAALVHTYLPPEFLDALKVLGISGIFGYRIFTLVHQWNDSR